MSIELFVMINDSMTYQFRRHICDKKKSANNSLFFNLKKKKKKTYCHILIWGLSLLKAFGHGLNGLGLGPALKGRWILYPK